MTADASLPPKPPATSLEVRARLVEALVLDLVGPGVGHALAEERLPGHLRPSTWYLCGFLIPSGTPPERSADADEGEDLDVQGRLGFGDDEQADKKAAKRGYFPSSMGLSFLVDAQAAELTVHVSWGDYAPVEIAGADGQSSSVWQRMPRAETIAVKLPVKGDPESLPVPRSDGLQLQVVERALASEDLKGRLPEGTRSVSVFLVNNRAPGEPVPDTAYAFQAQLRVTCDRHFIARPDLRGSVAEELDDRIADLHYADRPEYATGHGVSAEFDLVSGACGILRTAWMPSAEVEKTKTAPVPGAVLSMEVLADLADAAAARAALRPLVEEYRRWIEARSAELGKLSGSQRETAALLLQQAGHAATRIERGIEALASDDAVRNAFCMANGAVARALRQRLGKQLKGPPEWHAFQLAFLLLNVPGLAHPEDPDRETADLLFFPTGGGKTEAYLGLAAFAMVLRRLRHPGDKGLAGAGVSVIMRYTLRLLTLDQLSRAAGLVCALELERRKNPARYGEWPFEIGLWVGKAATPNAMGHTNDKRSDTARTKVNQYKADPQHKPVPIPLESCPWCGAELTRDSFHLEPPGDAPVDLRIVCVNTQCDFTRTRLPIVAVDEPLYRRLPAFLIATVDKFANLPWIGPAGALLGGADRADKLGFYGPAEPGKGTRLGAPLPPPDLVIQDELHLIAGPLGTMSGLYETAIEALCVRPGSRGPVRPKIIASTATVRRANDQVQALFARPLTSIFPPPGPQRTDSFFAQTVKPEDSPARLYLGIAAQGRNPKVVMRRAWLALMGAAQRAYDEAGGKRNASNPADPYMTVLGYFNALKELGGARRILEEEVQNTLKDYGHRMREGETIGSFANRTSFTDVVELTSRVPTDKVAEARRRLGSPFNGEQHVDCAIATNMISVGLDIPRLGLMVVLGQPKTHSEYIQATSRVGRDDERPGLVVTLLNIHKPRDRSHYERFRHYHETFYRSVEVASVTPFSARALDRGFAGALVALARHGQPILAPPRGVERLSEVRAALESQLFDAFFHRVRQQPLDPDEIEERLRSVQGRIGDLLDTWLRIVEDHRSVGVALQYQPHEAKPAKPLLRDMLETKFEKPYERKFRANRSLRDVEPEVNLLLRDLNGQPVDGDA